MKISIDIMKKMNSSIMVILESLDLSLYFQLKLLTKPWSVSLSSLIGWQMFQKYPLDIFHIIIYKLISTSSGFLKYVQIQFPKLNQLFEKTQLWECF